jgi:hypothetical protein
VRAAWDDSDEEKTIMAKTIRLKRVNKDFIRVILLHERVKGLSVKG